MKFFAIFLCFLSIFGLIPSYFFFFCCSLRATISSSKRSTKWPKHNIYHLKVHKHEIFLNFFLPKSNPYMPLVNFRKKFRLVSFDLRQNFEVRTFPRWLSIRGTKFLLRDIQKKFFFQNLHFVPLDGFLDGFSKFWFFIGKICISIRVF